MYPDPRNLRVPCIEVMEVRRGHEDGDTANSGARWKAAVGGGKVCSFARSKHIPGIEFPEMQDKPSQWLS